MRALDRLWPLRSLSGAIARRMPTIAADVDPCNYAMPDESTRIELDVDGRRFTERSA